MLPIGFTAGVLLHGLLDYVPHSYPLRSGPDVAFGLILFLLAITWAKRKHRPLVGACCFGSVLPDVVDLGPAIVNRLFGWSLPVVKIFPWHWHQYSGSIYDGTKRLESLVLHLGVIMLSVGTIYFYRKSLFASGPLVDSSAK
jgi:hypothetical protein